MSDYITRRILEALKAHPAGLNSGALADRAKCSRKVAMCRLKVLRAEGIVAHAGSTDVHASRYHLTEYTALAHRAVAAIKSEAARRDRATKAASTRRRRAERKVPMLEEWTPVQRVVQEWKPPTTALINSVWSLAA